ncbi:MAG: type VI secretion system protein TssA [Xanthomonadaceae bacterium]|jgi:type VI secretion system protein ImpA|nr:type VI secretion system protein TssA [Xanthomonadaceae bacterium]
MMDLEELLAPISADNPAGSDMSFSTEYDTIQNARRFDDPTLEQGEWITDIKTADWPAVERLCSNLLKTQTKDLRLGAWLTEAYTQINGFSGITRGFQLVAGLCDRYWDDIHPLAIDGDQEERIGNLSWLLMNSLQWLRTIPIVQGPLGRFSFNDYETAHARGSADTGNAAGLEVLEQARRDTPHEFYRNLLEILPDCATALQELQTAVDARLGMDGPSFGAVRDQLDNIQRMVQRFSKEAGLLYDGATFTPSSANMVEEFDAPQQSTETETVRVASAFRGANAPISTRKEALAQLRQIAEYFRRTEPHSPVAYLAERAARWGEMPLHIWLKRVIKDDGLLSQMEELLDVTQSSQPSERSE